MRNSRSMKLMLAALVLAVGTMSQAAPAGGAAGRGATAPAPAPGPLRLAVLNVGKLISSLDETVEDGASMETMRKNFSTELQNRRKEVDKLQEAFDRHDFTFDSPEYRKLEDELMQKTADTEAFMKVSQMRLFLELKSKKAAIYEKMVKVVAAYAVANGFGLVFATDDSNMLLAQSPEELRQMIELKKLIYYNPVLDITTPLIAKMNADYKLGASTPKK